MAYAHKLAFLHCIDLGSQFIIVQACKIYAIRMRHGVQHFCNGIESIFAVMQGNTHIPECISIEMISVNKLGIVFRKPKEYLWVIFQCVALNSYRREKAFWHIHRRLNSLQYVTVTLDFAGKRLSGNLIANRTSDDFAVRSPRKNFLR